MNEYTGICHICTMPTSKSQSHVMWVGRIIFFLLTQINIALHNQKQQLTGNPIKWMRVAGRCTGKIIEIQS